MQMAIPCLDQSMFEPDLLRHLIRGAKSGEAACFEKLVSLHEGRVPRLAQRLLLNREAAQDAAQDVFMRLHKAIRSVSEEKDLGPWLNRTTVNVCIDALVIHLSPLRLGLVIGMLITAQSSTAAAKPTTFRVVSEWFLFGDQKSGQFAR